MALAAGAVEVTAAVMAAVAMAAVAMVAATEAAAKVGAVPVEETVGAVMVVAEMEAATVVVATAGAVMVVVMAVETEVVEMAAVTAVRRSPRRRNSELRAPRTSHRIDSPQRDHPLQQRASLLLPLPEHRYNASHLLVLGLQTVRLSTVACPCSSG